MEALVLKFIEVFHLSDLELLRTEVSVTETAAGEGIKWREVTVGPRAATVLLKPGPTSTRLCRAAPKSLLLSPSRPS